MEGKQQERRLKILYITPELIFQLFTGKGKITISFSGMPDDAKLLNAGSVEYSMERHAFGMVVWSKEFDIVPDGLLLPELKITAQQFTDSRTHYETVETE